MPRLFTAVLIPEDIKDKLSQTIASLRKAAVKGNFTSRDNLHLTLSFIGETEKVHEAERAMDGIKASIFTLSIGGFGTFRRDGGDIYWIGVDKTGELISLQKQQEKGLIQAGFPLETREYKPHLTLGRGVFLQEGFDSTAFAQSLPEMPMPVKKISLMKSERLNGQLTYTEIYAVNLVRPSN